jgi:hypothetical protein
MTTLTNTPKHAVTLTNVAKPMRGGQVFFGWLFLFTQSSRAIALNNVAKHSATGITNVPKN